MTQGTSPNLMTPVNQVVPVAGTRLAALIAWLENMQEPDRGIDLEIINIGAKHPWRWHRRIDETITDDRYGKGAVGNPIWTLGRFTASIDDALSLLPEHFSYELTQSAVEPLALSRVRLWDWRRGPTGIDPGNEWKAEGNRPLVINICIAALKLRGELYAAS